MASNAKNLAELLNNESTIAVADVADGSITTAKLAADAVTAAKLADDSVVTANIVDGNVTAAKTTGVGKGKNIVINGDMTIAQRGTSAVTTSGAFTVDRWKNISNANDFSAQQSSVVPSGQGFYKSIHITPTSTKSPGSGTYFFTSHYIEGFNIGQLNWGTSSARTVTLSFWVRSSKTGIYTVGLKNADATRSRQQEYTISSADTWEKKTITITGATDGSWPVDNTRGIAIDFCLAGNASATSTVGSWIGANSNMSTNQVNFFDSTSANWYMTGVQLETGSNATDFEFLSYGEQLALCQRYLQKMTGGYFAGNGVGSSSISFGVPLSVPLRASPSIANNGQYTHRSGNQNSSANSISATSWDALRPSITLRDTGHSVSDEVAYVVSIVNSLYLDSEI